MPCCRVSLSEKFTRAEAEGEPNHVSEIALNPVWICEKREPRNKSFGGLDSGPVSSVILSESIQTWRGVDGLE